MTTPTQPQISPAFDRYLLEVTDAVNTTLDLNTLLQRIAEMMKRFLDYEIFAILLLTTVPTNVWPLVLSGLPLAANSSVFSCRMSVAPRAGVNEAGYVPMRF